MNCRELNEFLLDYVNGDLPLEARAGFEVHLSRCGHCVEYVRQYRLTIEAGQRAYGKEPLPTMPEELVRAILAARKTAS